MTTGETDLPVRPPTAPPQSPTHDASLDNVRYDAWVGEMHGVVAMHRSIAARLLREGNAPRAFAELVRASRAVPMTASLASALTAVALQSNNVKPAITLLTQGLEDADDQQRAGVERALIRLLRRSNQYDVARGRLENTLDDDPANSRARKVLNAILERTHAWDELDASLEREAREALRRNALRVASRTTLRRARLHSEQLKEHARAAALYAQAAQYAEQAGDMENTLLLRLLWLRALTQAKAPAAAIDEAIESALNVGKRVGKTDKVQALARGFEARTGTVERFEPSTIPEMPAVDGRVNAAQHDLIAVAESAPIATSGPEIAAILAAAVEEGSDPLAERKLEAHLVSRGSWRELVTFYQAAIGRTSDRAKQAEWSEKLAEVLESELNDVVGASQAWAFVVAATGDARAVKEQIRLSAAQKDLEGIRDALDAGVDHSKTPAEKANALVLRAEYALSEKRLDAAQGDFSAALERTANHPGALAGLAEIAATHANHAPTRELERVLKTLPRGALGRAELFRRLARLAHVPLHDRQLERAAWLEVRAELPDDRESYDRLVVLARALTDTALLESLLHKRLESAARTAETRQAVLELVALYERAKKPAVARALLQREVERDPKNAAAWLALSDRFSAAGEHRKSLDALEQGSAALTDKRIRYRVVTRVARVLRLEGADVGRAQRFEAEAAELAKDLPPKQLQGPIIAPRLKPRLPLRPAVPSDAEREFEQVAQAIGSRPEPELDAKIVVTVKQPSRLQALIDEFKLELESKADAQPLPAPTVPRPQPTPSVEVDQSLYEDEEPGGSTELMEVPTSIEASPRETLSDDDDDAPPPAPTVVPPRAAKAFVAAHDDLVELNSSDIEVPSDVDAPLGDDDLAPTRDDVAEPVDDDDVLSNAPGEGTTELPAELSDAEETSGHSRKSSEATRGERGNVRSPASAAAPEPVEDTRAVASSTFSANASAAMAAERDRYYARLKENPLDTDAYRLLAEHFDAMNEPDRSSLMLEVARAIDGDRHAIPRAPRLVLGSHERATLRHPLIRGELGEYFALVGPALCQLFPQKNIPFDDDVDLARSSGKGVPGLIEALAAAVRVLGIKVPPVSIVSEGPPFALGYHRGPRLLISKEALKRVFPLPELRFFAGRSLFTLCPDLMALRTLKKESLVTGLKIVGQVLAGSAPAIETKVVRTSVGVANWERLQTLHRHHQGKLNLNPLAFGARHSVNRAGLLVCGGIAPVVSAMREKQAPALELAELIRFSASERFLSLRSLRISKPK